MTRRAIAVKERPSKAAPDGNGTLYPKDGLRIEYVALSRLLRWPRNPKKHDKPGIRASILRFGYVDPIIVDEASGKMVAGHGRAEVLIDLKADVAKGVRGAVRPKNIFEQHGEWFVPLLRGQSFTSEHEAEGYLVANNRLVSNAGYDKDLLKTIMADFRSDQNVEALGWRPRELERFIVAPEESMPKLDERLRYQIVVDCADDEEQARLLERFEGEGLKCKPLIV